MTTENALAVCRSSARRLRPAILVLAVLLGPAAGAWAQGLVTLDKMTVARCADLTPSCEWRVTCRTGNEPEVELAKYWVAGVAAEMELGKSFDVASFPTKLECKLQEDDGWFGTSWEDAGTLSLDLPGGGNFELELGSEDQGHLVLELQVSSLELVEAAPPAAKPGTTAAGAAARPRRYVGVFAAQEGGHAVVAGLPWDRFKARADALAEQGSKPAWLSSYEEGGTRSWSGIFRPQDGNYEIVYDLPYADFFKKWEALTKRAGMQLADVEIYGVGGKVRATGLFQEGVDLHNFRVGQTRQDFFREFVRFAGKDLRLVDLEIYSVGGPPLFAGAYRAGAGSYGLLAEPNFEWETFQARAKSAREQGLGLGDIESYVDGGKRLYAGVLRSGGGELTPPLDAASFTARWQELVRKGLRLVSLESFK